MNNTEIRKEILRYLAEAFEQNGSAMVKMKPLAEKLDIPFDELRMPLGTLYEQGLVHTVVGEEHAMLLPKGVKIALPSDPGVPKQPPRNINFNGPVNQSAIALDQGQANVTVTNAKLESFVSQLTKAIDEEPGLPETKKKDWKKFLLEISKHPALAALISKLLGGG